MVLGISLIFWMELFINFHQIGNTTRQEQQQQRLCSAGSSFAPKLVDDSNSIQINIQALTTPPLPPPNSVQVRKLFQSLSPSKICLKFSKAMTSVAWRHGDSSRKEETGGAVETTTQDEVIKVCVQHEPISLEHLTIWASAPEAGAVSSFLGVTRNNFNGKKVVRLEYEGYVPMAEKVLLGISEQVFKKWEGICRVAMVHRLGIVPVGEASVVIVISSPHRKDSLEAVHFSIDQIKALVPIWKKEIYGGGEELQENEEVRRLQEMATCSNSETSPKWKTNSEWDVDEAAEFSATSM